MRHFPIFLRVDRSLIVVSGAGETAVAKLRLLLKTDADIAVYGANPHADIVAWAKAGRLRLTARALAAGDADGAALVYGANEDAEEDARIALIARDAGALVNIADDLSGSDFITPAIVDRDPVTVAIGTEGAAPVLARRIKADVEAMLPASLGVLARIAERFRPAAEKLPMGRLRRAFWSRFFFEDGPRRLAGEGTHAVEAYLPALLEETIAGHDAAGRVALVGTGPGEPDLLTLKARRLIDAADVVVHDRLVPQAVLELARREAVIVATGGADLGQNEVDALLADHARDGAHVVRLKAGDPFAFGRFDAEIAALDAAGIDWEAVPGISVTSAAAAASGRPLTGTRPAPAKSRGGKNVREAV